MIFSEDVLERNFGKYLCWAIIFIGLGFVIALRLSFLDEAYNDDEAKIKKLLVELNADLPREIGTIGIQDSITFENNTLIFHHTVQGGEMIKGFYEEHYAKYKEVLKYALVSLNGQCNNGYKFAQIFFYKGFNACVSINTGYGEPVSWTITGKELKAFVDSCKLNPSEALKTSIDMELMMLNMTLPINGKKTPNVGSVVTNSLVGDFDKYCLLMSVRCKDNFIFLYFDVDEKNYDLNVLKNNAKDINYVENLTRVLSEDKDFQEFLGMLALSHSDLGIIYKGRKTKKTVSIVIPYTILCKYCSVPSDLLLNN